MLLSKAITQQLGSSQNRGLLFSGGLDSSILLVLHSQLNTTPLSLIVSGTASSKDIQAASRAANALTHQLEIQNFTLNDVENSLPTIISAINSTDVLQVSLAIPLHFAAMRAQKLGVTTLISGQGADELFGGYARYERLVQNDELQLVSAEMQADLITLERVTLPCQQSMAKLHDIHFVAPFLAPDIVTYSQSIPLHYKIADTGSGIIRKRILRTLAKNLGLPEFIAKAPKRALQYGSGASRILERLSMFFWQRREPSLSNREARSYTNIHRFLCLVQEGVR
jgi:asparagine synthase (glutamine-hydrolysing)